MIVLIGYNPDGKQWRGYVAAKPTIRADGKREEPTDMKTCWLVPQYQDALAFTTERFAKEALLLLHSGPKYKKIIEQPLPYPEDYRVKGGVNHYAG